MVCVEGGAGPASTRVRVGGSTRLAELKKNMDGPQSRTGNRFRTFPKFDHQLTFIRRGLQRTLS